MSMHRIDVCRVCPYESLRQDLLARVCEAYGMLTSYLAQPHKQRNEIGHPRPNEHGARRAFCSSQHNFQVSSPFDSAIWPLSICIYVSLSSGLKNTNIVVLSSS